MLLLFAPLLVLSAAAIRLESRGPVMFRQARVGLRGQLFRIHKLRTMRVNVSGPDLTTGHDSRITLVGRILRWTKIDELPQLIDVLHGDMSLVGPRPEVQKYVDLWAPDLREVILSVRPGITDPATAALRNEGMILSRSSDPERSYVEDLLPWKTHVYAHYVTNRSFCGDIAVLLMTLRVIILPATVRHPIFSTATAKVNPK